MAIDPASPPQAEALTPLTNRHRILSTVDPLGKIGSEPSISSKLLPQRITALARIYLGIQQVQDHLQLITQALSVRMLPQQLVGQLQQPDGTAAGILQVGFDPSALNSNASPVTVQTDASG